RTHDPSFHLFRVGEEATEGLKRFAEKGETEGLETSSQGGGGGVLDDFSAPPIPKGVGVTKTQFFVDGNHSRVSVLGRIVPSPDWFIGVDSFDLCVDGQWLESVVLEVDPLDAGTDNGFTFTSPNWPSVPRKPVSRITSQNPSHPANSFYYPDVDQHPPIATLYLAKVREYQLSQEFTPPSPSTIPTRFTSADLARPSSSRQRQYLNRDEEEDLLPTVGERDNEVNSNSILLPTTAGRLSGSNEGGTITTTSTTTTTTSKPPSSSLLNSLVKKYRKKYRKNRRGRKSGAGRKLRGHRRRSGGRRRPRVPRDCRVTEWAEWAACSKTCGIGEQMRTRAVMHPSRRGGRPCPPLKETKWCGSSRDCDHKYFDW
ncbi:hypothetical protein Pmani_007722, partial [Petrolisthes manimaculis]